MIQPKLYAEALRERFGRPPVHELRRFPTAADADTPANIARRRRVLLDIPTNEEDQP